MDLMWSLRDKHIHWNCDYQYCEFSRQFDALYQAPSYASPLNCIHCGQSLQQYLEDRIYHESGVKQFCQRDFAVHGSVPVNSIS